MIGVDDAQLLDPVSAALVLDLATSGSAFVLATVRAGEPCPHAIVSSRKDDTARRMELAYLSNDAVRSLVEAALGDPVEEAALDWVAEVSRGNVLYVRELVRGAVEAGALVRSPGFWRLEGRLTASPSLVDLIGQRMDALTASHLQAVELLALGEPLALEEIEALMSEDTLLEAESHGLIATDGEEVRLAHPLSGEAGAHATAAADGRAASVCGWVEVLVGSGCVRLRRRAEGGSASSRCGRRSVRGTSHFTGRGRRTGPGTLILGPSSPRSRAPTPT